MKEDKDPIFVSPLYSDFQVLDNLGLSLKEFRSLHRWDLKALKYYLVMKGYYQDLEFENIKKDK